MTTSQLRQFALVVLTASAIGCSRKQDAASVDSTHVDSTAQAQVISIVPADSTPYPKVKLSIVSPREGQVLANAADSVRVIMMVTGTELGKRTAGDSTKGIAFTPQGQHIHVIVDNKPYMANYTNGQPFNVGVLTPGVHTIRAFPSFSWHESIKSEGAFGTRTFFVGAKSAASENNLLGPMLTYSRPKGTYKSGEGQKVLLDFYVSNAKLGADGYKVKLTIDGKEQPAITEWKPYYIEGLSKGKHTVALQLLDPKGAVVPGSFNSTSQEITVE